MEFIGEVPGAPKAIGPYSVAAVTDSLIFLSGQIPLDPTSGELVKGGIEEQTKRVLENIRAVLKSFGLDFRAVAKTTIFLTDLGHFQKVNELYAAALGPEARPARSTIQVAGLPKGALVEIEMIVSRKR